MSQNPINLAVRFLLKIGALISMDVWGGSVLTGVQRIISSTGLPFLAAVLLGTFTVPGDRSRSGKAPVRVSGWVRLILELTFFSSAVWALLTIGAVTIS